jgi:hypothetical protein
MLVLSEYELSKRLGFAVSADLAEAMRRHGAVSYDTDARTFRYNGPYSAVTSREGILRLVAGQHGLRVDDDLLEAYPEAQQDIEEMLAARELLKIGQGNKKNATILGAQLYPGNAEDLGGYKLRVDSDIIERYHEVTLAAHETESVAWVKPPPPVKKAIARRRREGPLRVVNTHLIPPSATGAGMGAPSYPAA